MTVAAFLAHSMPLVLIAAVSPVLFLNASRVVEAAGMKTNKIRIHNYDLKHCLTPYDNVLVPARTAPKPRRRRAVWAPSSSGPVSRISGSSASAPS